MKCPKCQPESPGDTRFCNGCGHRLEFSCHEGWKLNPPGSKFHNECCHDLREPKETPPFDYDQPRSYTPKPLPNKIITTRRSVQGEQKLVTTLFADVANYTSMTEKLGPEEVHQIMDDCFKILMDEIQGYDVKINKFTGDEVMDLFGDPKRGLSNDQ